MNQTALNLPDGPIILDMPEADYHAHPAMSSSLIRAMDVPARYRWQRDNPKTPTYTMVFGSALHCAVLEPGAFDDRYSFKGDGRTKAGKEHNARVLAQGQALLSYGDLKHIAQMAEALRANPLSQRLTAHGNAEVSAFWTDEETGVECRLRADWANPAYAAPVLMDIKTTTDANWRHFSRSIHTYGYHRQAAWYIDGWKAITGEEPWFCFTVIEKEPPHLIAHYAIDPIRIAAGRAANRRALRRYVECRDSDTWPGLNDAEIHTIDVPVWARRDDMETL